MSQTNLHISSITVYPIKSCKGISLQSSVVEERGLQFDRRWMLVDENNSFLSQRAFPKMSLIETAIEKEFLLICAPTMSELRVPIISESRKVLSTIIWDDIVQAISVSKEADEWFSEFLQTQCKLVYQPDESIRTVDKKYAKNNEQTSFADAFPFLVISDASLDALNEKLLSPVLMNRFRPNITISGSEPFAEDAWKKIHVNGITFSLVKPCARCVVTTVEQSTGITGKEPLRTLSEFRTFNNKVLFGQNAVADRTGNISVNDSISIRDF